MLTQAERQQEVRADKEWEKVTLFTLHKCSIIIPPAGQRNESTLLFRTTRNTGLERHSELNRGSVVVLPTKSTEQEKLPLVLFQNIFK